MEKTLRDLNPDDYFSTSLKVFAHQKYHSEASRVQAAFEELKYRDHIAVFSSGTTSASLKGYALSLDAVMNNARAVNDFYSIDKNDRWGLSIPDYHIGGLSVMMRAKLLGNSVVDCRGWNPHQWRKTLDERKVTVTTVVPTQIYDLVKENLSPPRDLRVLIVGGDYLSFELENQARKLGWPTRRTYGMTEIGSQLASAKDKNLEVLTLHQVKTDSDGRLLVKSPALFSAQFILKDKVDISPVEKFLDKDGFYATQDKVRLEGKNIVPLGRVDEQIKVGGHMVSLPPMKETLYTVLLATDHNGKAEVAIMNDERKGKGLRLLHLQGLPTDVLRKITEAFGPHSIDEIRAVEAFERTDLGKLKKV
jgi:O-succinylbenzoic acid--CoA ligase